MNEAPAAAGTPDLAAAADAQLQAFDAELARLMAERSPERLRDRLSLGCWIHGAGLYGRSLAVLLRTEGFPVLGFIDRKAGPALSSVDGLPASHPAQLEPSRVEGRTFVGGVLNPGAASQDVLAWAEQLPFAAFVLGADLPDALGEAAMTCWQAPRSLIHRNLETISRTARRLADATSLDIYMALLTYRITGDGRRHPPIDAANSYLPRDLPGFENSITFVDAGAYTGDTCQHLMGHGVQIGRYVAFEPDRANFAQLGEFVRSARIDEATLLPCALSDRLHTVRLEGEGVSCRLVEGGVTDASANVLCLSLDETLPGLKPDFVKMDIEGSELAALRGMAEIISACHPRLAISIYHRAQDLWEIPDWVAGHYDGLHVRQHGAHGFDTVLYTLPG